MRTIEFDVAGQRLRKTSSDMLVAGSKGGYIKAHFKFDSEWRGMRVAASFFDQSGKEHAVLVKRGKCAVPDEVTDGRAFEVSVTGTDGTAMVTTNRVPVIQEVR